jgi:phosphohistidine phosphatase
MMDLLLWRHAEAFDARFGEDDLQRALTPRGQEQAARIGRWLNEVLPADARVLASPAKRTQQTVQALGRPFETVPAVVSGASAREVLEAAGWPRAGGTVLVVGHQPTLGRVAARLMCGSEQYWHVPKASVWWLRAEGDEHATLVAMRSPEHA